MAGAILFGPSLVVMILLAALPRGRPFFVGLAVVLTATLLAGLGVVVWAERQTDPYAHLVLVGPLAVVFAALSVVPSQLLRWRFVLAWPTYLPVLLGTAFAATTVFGLLL